jgi:hypothetical protein
MAKPVRTMYFAFKLIAPRVGDKRMLAEAATATSSVRATTHFSDDGINLAGTGARVMRIGAGIAKTIPGVAGHFTSAILDFSDAEDRKCKTLGEAEQLVKKNYKAWLADAYDWFVVPATIETSAGTAPGKAAKARKTNGK